MYAPKSSCFLATTPNIKLSHYLPPPFLSPSSALSTLPHNFFHHFFSFLSHIMSITNDTTPNRQHTYKSSVKKVRSRTVALTIRILKTKLHTQHSKTTRLCSDMFPPHEGLKSTWRHTVCEVHAGGFLSDPQWETSDKQYALHQTCMHAYILSKSKKNWRPNPFQTQFQLQRSSRFYLYWNIQEKLFDVAVRIVRNRWIDGGMDRQKDRRTTDGQMDGQNERQKKILMDGRINEWMEWKDE